MSNMIPSQIASALSVYPGLRKLRVTAKDARAFLLEVPIPFALAGKSYDVVCRNVGAGVKELYLKPWKP